MSKIQTYIVQYQGRFYLSKNGPITSCPDRAKVFMTKEEADTVSESENIRLKTTTVKTISYKVIEQ